MEFRGKTVMPQICSVRYARSTLPESDVFPQRSKEKRIPIVFLIFVIRAGDRTVLVDTGCETMKGFALTDQLSPVAALEREGIRAEEITDLVITHAHHDHIACADCFSRAAITIQKDEYEKGKRYLPSSASVRLFEDRCTVCDGVCAVKIGGHSVGSSVVEVKGNGTTFVIAGDECYSYENLDRQIPTGVSVCPEKSLAFVKEYAKKEYTVLLMHDEKESV